MNSNRIAASLLASCVLMLSIGCGLEAPNVPAPDASAVVVTEETLHGPYQGTFSSPGGSLGDSAAWFDVSANALVTPTVITMVVSTASETVATMSPHGQTFANACTLSFTKPLNYQPEDVYYVYLWDETTEEWDELGGMDHGSYVSIQITHFSEYSLQLQLD